jgi:hypothetical protein
MFKKIKFKLIVLLVNSIIYNCKCSDLEDYQLENDCGKVFPDHGLINDGILSKRTETPWLYN